jgi:hypothetical protein
MSLGQPRLVLNGLVIVSFPSLVAFRLHIRALLEGLRLQSLVVGFDMIAPIVNKEALAFLDFWLANKDFASPDLILHGIHANVLAVIIPHGD